MKLRYERGALADLDEIFAYIASDNPDAAARLVDRFERTAAGIAETPHMGEATRKSGFRRFPVGNYLIVYEIGDEEVIIHYVRHARDGGHGKTNRSAGRRHLSIAGAASAAPALIDQ